MKDQLQKRLADLKTEYETGQKMLARMENDEIILRNNLLRISGAIQVLEEELEKSDTGNKAPETIPLGAVPVMGEPGS